MFKLPCLGSSARIKFSMGVEQRKIYADLANVGFSEMFIGSPKNCGEVVDATAAAETPPLHKRLFFSLKSKRTNLSTEGEVVFADDDLLPAAFTA